MKEFNISQSKLKLFTILRGKTMSQPRLKLELSMFNTKDNNKDNNKSKHQLLRPPKLKEHLIKPMQVKMNLELEELTFREEAELGFQVQPTSQSHIQQDNPTQQLDQPPTQQGNPTQQQDQPPTQQLSQPTQPQQAQPTQLLPSQLAIQLEQPIQLEDTQLMVLLIQKNTQHLHTQQTTKPVTFKKHYLLATPMQVDTLWKDTQMVDT